MIFLSYTLPVLLAVVALMDAAERAVFRDVNILVVTDTHSWLAAHMHNDQAPPANATIGNITNFVSTMKAQAKLEGRDVFFFDNGDVVDGTGLSNAAETNGQELFPLLMEIPFDAMSIGNHELYDASTVKEMISSAYMSSRNGTYLASNVYLSETMQPLASRYAILKGPNSGIRLLVFGVLYDMTDNTDFVHVEAVSSMLTSDWFITALTTEEYDAVVVLAHMDYAEPLIDDILQGIRAHVLPGLPIQFLTGHSHIRATSTPDASSGNIEAGNYYNTIGYSSFDVPQDLSESKGTAFHFTFYEPNTAQLAEALGVPERELLTRQGLLLDSDVADTRQGMGLLDRIGTTDKHYFISAPVASEHSLYNYYVHQVAPSTLFTPSYNTSQILISGTGILRYDLFAGEVIVDDVWTLCPFSEPYYSMVSLSGEDVAAALVFLNSDKYDPFRGGHGRRGPRPVLSAPLPNYVSSAIPQSGIMYDVIASEWDAEFVSQALGVVLGTGVPPEPQVYGNINTTELWLLWMEQGSKEIQ